MPTLGENILNLCPGPLDPASPELNVLEKDYYLIIDKDRIRVSPGLSSAGICVLLSISASSFCDDTADSTYS